MVRAAAKTLASSSIARWSVGSGGWSSLTAGLRQKRDCWPGSRCMHQWPSSWPIVKRRRPGHSRASAALTQISPGPASSRPEMDWPGARGGGAGRGGHVLDVADEQAEAGVGDVLDRDRQLLAVPDPVGDPGEDLLGASFQLLEAHQAASLPAPEQAVDLVPVLLVFRRRSHLVVSLRCRSSGSPRPGRVASARVNARSGSPPADGATASPAFRRMSVLMPRMFARRVEHLRRDRLGFEASLIRAVVVGGDLLLLRSPTPERVG